MSCEDGVCRVRMGCENGDVWMVGVVFGWWCEGGSV